MNEEERVISRLAEEKMVLLRERRAEDRGGGNCTNMSVLTRSGILTPDIVCVDECFAAPGTREMEEVGRRSKSMKPSDNEIWPAFYKDTIRPAFLCVHTISRSGSSRTPWGQMCLCCCRRTCKQSRLDTASSFKASAGSNITG